jgi:outer membrane lipoprotein-sorting protein
MNLLRRHSRQSVLLLLLLVLSVSAGAQEIATASEYFDGVATNYAAIETYAAEMVWSDAGGTMRGSLYYKRPNLIRIDFEQPEEQWLIFDGDDLMIYVPPLNTVLLQSLRDSPGSAGVGAFTAEGLDIMRRTYDVTFLESAEPVPIDQGSSLLVTELRLERRAVTEGFRELVLSIDETGFIRRIVATKVDWEQVQMDLSDIQINQLIPDALFEEEFDPSASVDEDFLYNPEG